jgi:hypothetical protein
VVIDQVTLTGDASAGGVAPSQEPAQNAPMNEAEFRHHYETTIRAILREEIERALRHRAD